MNWENYSTLFLLGRPFSPLYGVAMKLRALLYHKNILASRRLNVPVISIGNLTMGGTGKTPMVIYLARFLAEQGYKPAIISRGYHGKSRAPVNLVSDGSAIMMSAEAAGDEPVLLAGRLEGMVIATGKKRYQVALEAIKTHSCDLVLLDDGFQHLSLARDLNLVLFDVNHFAGTSRVFPGGELREPVSALKRSDAFIITGVSDNSQERASKCSVLLQEKFAGKPVFNSSVEYSGCYKVTISPAGVEKKMMAISDLPEQLFAVSAIARPERFYRMANERGLALSGTKSFRDHHAFSQEDIQKLTLLADDCKASGFLITEKDLVKLTEEHHSHLPFYVPLLELVQNNELEAFILNNLNKMNRC